LFCKTFKFRFEIDGPEDSFVMAFRANSDDFWMEVRPYVPADGRMLTVTLDDMSKIRHTISMSDANGLMFIAEDGGGALKRLRRCVICAPIFAVLAKAFFTVVGSIGMRYLKENLSPRSTQETTLTSPQKADGQRPREI
jgi:hypothetical protein